MAANKTVPTAGSVADFLGRIASPQRLADAGALIDLMQRIAGEPPRMWGPSIIGFRSYHYRHDSGREGDMPRISFSPRKTDLVLYVGVSRPEIAALLPSLGKHRTGKGCLYVKSLGDVDVAALEAIIRQAWANRSAG